MKILRIPLVIVLVVLAARGVNANAQTESNLYSFGGSPDGANPEAPLVQGSDGNFYGTTYFGGTSTNCNVGCGTVFRISPSGSLTNLYSFGTVSNDGNFPSAGLVQGSDGNFYGTTQFGGTIDDGTVFRISLSGSYTNLHSFLGSPIDGKFPSAGLVQGSDGNFYGTTEYGGTNDDGAVFRISPSGSYTNLYSFLGSPIDGKFPSAGLVQGSDGNFYGTTQFGGTNDDGTVFRINPSGSYTNLYSFGTVSNDGVYPLAGLVQGSDGNFYGTTIQGGAYGYGTVFRISPSGSYTNLYAFGTVSNDGNFSSAGLVQGSDGNFYGTTYFGGTIDDGTVFRISPSGSYTNLYSFNSSPNDGSKPLAGLVQGSDGNFYGTTTFGGINDNGTVFKAFALIPIPQNTSTNTWISGLDGKWETSTNWSNGAAPSLADSADTITNANTKTVTIDSVSTNTPGVMTISNLIVSAPLGSTNTLLLNNAGAGTPLQVLNGLTIGSGGALMVSGSSLVAGSVSNAGVIQATGGTLEFFGFNVGTNDTLSGYIAITNGAALLLSGTDSWTIVSGIAYGGGTSGGSIISSNSGVIQSVFLSNPAFCDNEGTLAVVGGNVINYGQIGADLTNNYVITGSGGLTGSFGPNNYAILNQGTIASVSGGTLVLDPRDAFDFGGVQNASAIVVASGSTLSIRRTENAWDNPAASCPTNFGTIFMQGGILRAEDASTASTNRVCVNGVSGVIEGCGTFSNWTTVLNNGLILANCGTTLTFSGVVTNNGTMRAANGNVLEAYGTVVNNGTIDIINGGVTNFHGGFVNNGTVLTAGSVAISSIFVAGSNVNAQIPWVPGHTYQLQFSSSLTPTNWVTSGATPTQSGNTLTFIDSGGATNVPARFYRVLVTAP
jgi:uncharacterized repeat protein (TIGR03803 family)